MIVVSNSGPIISFARASSLDILRQVLKEIIIPSAVYKEKMLIEKIMPIGDELRRTGLRIKNALYQKFLQEIGE